MINMGKIKTKLVKKTAETFVKEGVAFTDDFERNKKILEDTMPSKKIRNQVAGFATRIKRRKEKKPLVNLEEMQ